MDTWVNQLHARASIVHGQISAWMSAMQSGGANSMTSVQRDAVLRPLYDMLNKIYSEDLPVAHVKDASDIVVHAEGPAAVHSTMQLRAVNWLSAKVRQQFILLAEAALPANGDTKVIARKVQWNVTGVAPGSIFMGFAVDRPASASGFEESDKLALDLIVKAAQAVPVVPQFVEDGFVDQAITDALTDPAVRDAAMFAAMRLAPTDASGLVTVEVTSSDGSYGVLGQRERIVLRESLKSPLFGKKLTGSFIGEVREVDLDSARFQLRNIDHVGSLRCSGIFTHDEARAWLGKTVKVTGTYETDKTGRPRLMRADVIESAPPTQRSFH
ncbi:hypothetical protein [Paraburkholderia terrae]|uniref:hypothetical protein n=1 Tax=Paraburkholderia terrae TaxID=311230 RepID=UPI001EE1873D|nr:hypothetical protein [Paraburkholderia terrae]GJH05006.1 hypothetical protein CBA19C8_30635 [Paraburkholderia terrae]